MSAKKIEISKKKIAMAKQPPQKRIKNFNEVALGYSGKDAIREAVRCLGCKNPKCVAGCPVEIDIPGFIKLTRERKFREAIDLIKEKNALPGICGRVCPQETQCELVCVLAKKQEPVAIGRLERFCADRSYGLGGPAGHRKVGSKKAAAKKDAVKKDAARIAVIGSGPAGITCAGELAKMGYAITIFESLSEAGGVLRYGIPEFRLPKAILDTELEYVKSLGVEIQVDMVIGMVKKIKDLFGEGYKAVYVGTGAGLPYFMGVPGENLNGVYSANEFLTRINLMKAYKFPEYDTPIRIGKKVAVIGAGNVAMDAARCAVRLGAGEVTIVYRRTRTEMPAREEEVLNAEEEGIKFHLLAAPTRLLGEAGWVKKMECIKMELGEPDESGRRRPVPIANSEFMMDTDTVVVAIGQGANPLLLERTEGLKLNKRGYIEADKDGATSIPGVFAGGDIVTGAATVISAMGMGKRSARAIDGYLRGEK